MKTLAPRKCIECGCDFKPTVYYQKRCPGECIIVGLPRRHREVMTQIELCCDWRSLVMRWLSIIRRPSIAYSLDYFKCSDNVMKDHLTCGTVTLSLNPLEKIFLVLLRRKVINLWKSSKKPIG